MTFRRTRCPHCKGKLAPGQHIHPDCIDGYAEATAAKKEREDAKRAIAAAKAEKATTKQRKEAIKTLPVLKREAQVAFNRWIRARDETQPCISCCAAAPSGNDYQGGRDAGHYRSVGAAPHLRYHEDNVHAQCVSCNQHKSGNAVDYRIGLLARLGVARVEAVEHDNIARHYTADDLREIRKTYVAKLRDLKRIHSDLSQVTAED